jgi:hypothetical protein
VKRRVLLRNAEAMVVIVIPSPEALTVAFPGWIRAFDVGCGAGWLAAPLGPTAPPPDDASTTAGVASTAADSASELATTAVAR